MQILVCAGIRGRRMLAATSRTLAGALAIGRLGLRFLDRVYVLAADPADPDSSSDFQVLDGVSQKWHMLESPGPIKGGALTHVIGQLYATGGEKAIPHSRFPPSRKVSVYNRTSRQWWTAPPMNERRSQHAAACLEGRLVVIGGQGHSKASYSSDDSVILSSMERLEPEKGVWELLPHMPTPRKGCAGVVVGEELYVIGGQGLDGPCDAVEVYNPWTGYWRVGPSLLYPRSSCTALPLLVKGRHKIVVVGGGDGHVQLLDTALQSWEEWPSLGYPRAGCALLLLNDYLYVVGGEAESGQAVPTEVFHPDNNKVVPRWDVVQSWGSFGNCIAALSQ